jgi:hypothetical protein
MSRRATILDQTPAMLANAGTELKPLLVVTLA